MIAFNVLMLCLVLTANCILLLDEDQPRGSRIMGGSLYRHDAVASVRLVMQQGNFHLCGAVIASENWVVSAAQCVIDATVNNTIVGVGTNFINPTTTYALEKIICHPYFDVREKILKVSFKLVEEEFSDTNAGK